MEELQSGVALEGAAVEPMPAPVSAVEEPPVAEVPAPPAVMPLVEGGRRYETLIIVPIRFEGPAFDPLSADIRKIYETEGALIASIDIIGRRQFASKIGKQSEGIYVNIVFSALPAAIALIERDLRHMESIMRYLTIVKE